MEQQDRASTSFKEIIQRAVNAEAKAGLKSSIMIQDLDPRYPRGHRPSHNISSKVQTQGTTAKKPRTEKSRPKEAKSVNGKISATLRSNEPAKPNCEKKRRQWLIKIKDSTSAIEDNAIKGKKK